MVFMPIGYSRQSLSPYKKLADHARIVSNRCGINVSSKDPEQYIFDVLEKLARDNEQLLLEVEKLEQQNFDFRPSNETVTTTEASRLLNCSSETVRSWIKKGFLNGILVESNRNNGHVFRVYVDEAFDAVKDGR